MSKYQLAVEDIAVGVFTSALNLRERALSVQNTWLDFFPNGYLIGGWHNDPALKMISLGPDVGEDYASAHKKQFYGILELRKRIPNAKWFYLTGCDAFVFGRNLVHLLGHYDHSRPFFIGGHCGSANIDGDALLYPSGGPGFALSSALVENIYDYIPQFVVEWASRKDGLANACDVALTYLISKKASVKLEYARGFYNNPPYDYPENGFLDGSGLEVHEKSIDAPIAYHGLSIREMYELSTDQTLSRPGAILKLTDKTLKRIGRLLRTKTMVNTISRIMARARGNIRNKAVG